MSSMGAQGRAYDPTRHDLPHSASRVESQINSQVCIRRSAVYEHICSAITWVLSPLSVMTLNRGGHASFLTETWGVLTMSISGLLDEEESYHRSRIESMVQLKYKTCKITKEAFRISHSERRFGLRELLPGSLRTPQPRRRHKTELSIVLDTINNKFPFGVR